MVAEGTFREDLFYRVGEIVLQIPSLKERDKDVVLLAKTFLAQYAEDFNSKVKGFSDTAVQAMLEHSWPGNIRELQNKLKSAVILAEGTMIQATDLSLRVSGEEVEEHIFNLRRVREKAETRAIRSAYNQVDGNISKTSELLGITRPTLYSLIDKYSLEDLKTNA
jgi:two-component system NtrC family response regulator